MNNEIRIPGVSFSWRRLLGLTTLQQRLSKQLGIPLTRSGLEKKIGRTIMNLFK